jgi:hypothetical protein
MERSKSNQGVFCIAIGLVFMGISAFGGWRFGWSLGVDPVDRWWHAILYGGADVAAGALVAQGVTMLRAPGWGTRFGGMLGLVPAVVLVLISVLSTFGVMSGRIAVLAGQERAEKVDIDGLTWLRGQVLNDRLPVAERRAFLLEERKASREARDAAINVPDKQAVGLSKAAKAFGFDVSVSSAQLVLTGLSSTLPMTIQFVCLGIGFFVRAGPGAGSRSGPGRPDAGSGVSTGRPKLRVVQAEPRPAVVKFGKREFMAFVKRELDRGPLGASTHKIAKATGWAQTSVVRAQRKLRERASAASGGYAGNGAHFPDQFATAS